MNRFSTARLIRLSAVAVVVGSLAAGTGGWVALDAIEATAALTPALRQVGEPSSELIENADATLEEMRGSLVTLSAITDRVAVSSGDAADIMSDVASLSTHRIPGALEALQEALPAVVNTAAVIDDTMETLSSLGIDYRPPVPLDDAFTNVETQLEGLPDTIRRLGSDLEDLAEEVRAGGDETALLTQRIDAIDENLADAQVILEDYDTALGSLDRLAGLGETVDPLIPIARVVVIVLCLAGLTLGVTGWQVSSHLGDAVGPGPTRSP